MALDSPHQGDHPRSRSPGATALATYPLLISALLLTGCQSALPTPPAAADPSATSVTTQPTRPPSVSTSTRPTPSATRATTEASSRTYSEATRRIRRATDAGRTSDPETFTTPSRNIWCTLAVADPENGPACEILEGRIRDTRCGTGDAARDVGRIVFRRGAATPECNSDTMFAGPPATVLPYGRAAHLQQGSVECLSERTGITCVDNASRRGFVLSRGAYRLLR